MIFPISWQQKEEDYNRKFQQESNLIRKAHTCKYVSSSRISTFLLAPVTGNGFLNTSLDSLTTANAKDPGGSGSLVEARHLVSVVILEHYETRKIPSWTNRRYSSKFTFTTAALNSASKR